MKIKISKAIKCIMAISMVLGLFQSSFLDTKAASGTMQVYPNSNWKYLNRDYSTFGDFETITVNGKTSFCVLPGVNTVNGAVVTETTPEAAGISVDLAKRLALIQYYGMRLGTADDYAITTSAIWNALGSASYVGSPTAPNWPSVANYINNINDKINRYHTRPSIHNGSYTLNVGESVTLTDTNGVLSDYDVIATGGLTVTKSGNSIILTALSTSDDEATISFKNKVSLDLSQTNVVYQKPGVQTVGSFTATDPMAAQVLVKVNKFGSLKIAKKDTEGNSVPGTKFRLSYKSDMSDPIGDYTTGADGTVQIDNLQGTKTVYYQEISVPANLVIDKTIRSVVIVPNDVEDTTITNKIQTGTITAKKEDADTGSKPQGEATLQGGVYGLYAKNDIVDPITKKVYFSKDAKVSERITKAGGSMDPITGLHLGDYYLKEITPPTGYLLDTTKYDVSLTYAGDSQEVVTKNQTVKDTVINGDFQITKVAEVDPYNSEINDPEPGAEFQVVLKKYIDQYGSVEEAWNHRSEFSDREYDLLTTDDEGIAKSKKLAYGTYVVKQTKVGDKNLAILKDPFQLVINTPDQKTIKFVISNQKFLSYLQLVKKDAQTGKTVSLSKTSFKVFDVKNNKYLSQRVGMERFDIWTTDETGIVTLPLEVPAGFYRLEEIKAPDGYLLNTDTIDFEMTEANVSIVDGENKPIQIVEFGNEKPTGTTKIVKTDKVTGEVLSGVQYRLTAKEDVIDPADGSIIYKAGEPISTDISENGYYVTNELGEIEVADLPMGSYTWKETKALDGYVKDEKEYHFTLSQKNDKQKIYTHQEDLVNQKTRTEITKLDKAGFEVLGAEMTILDTDGNAIDTWISGFKPHMVKGLLVEETYTLREQYAPEGYVQAKDVTFTVKNEMNTQVIKMIDKQVYAQKIDEDNKPLSGATLQIISSKTKNIVDQWITDGEPHAISGLLESESYILQEIQAPEGLEVAEDIEFTIDDSKATQSLEMSDKYILTKIQVNKVDSITKQAIRSKDFEFTTYRDKDCKDPLTTVNADTEKGTATFKLRYGEWWIKETKAPVGFLLSDEVKHVVIDSEGVFVNDKKVSEEDTIYSFIYYNTPMEDDVRTGDLTNTDRNITLLVFSGIFVGFTYFLWKRKNVD